MRRRSESTIDRILHDSVANPPVNFTPQPVLDRGALLTPPAAKQRCK
jgi:hypothetical protein